MYVPPEIYHYCPYELAFSCFFFFSLFSLLPECDTPVQSEIMVVHFWNGDTCHTVCSATRGNSDPWNSFRPLSIKGAYVTRSHKWINNIEAAGCTMMLFLNRELLQNEVKQPSPIATKRSNWNGVTTTYHAEYYRQYQVPSSHNMK